MKELQDIYKKTSEFSVRLAITLLCSAGLYLYVNLPNLEKVIGGVVFQFLASMIFGYVISQFAAFYKKNDWKKIWLIIYQLIVAISILAAILGIIPSNNN
ncbi:hypothetical protein [Geofilum rhodophaeum]|uniref:hypothetical protein n=1 Tax=Geofilum rhodophaeum TaxID=1965019 RepID=UPI000B520270|nr:hypothetical protein [Geofilum rhodophaeum]